MVEFEKMREFVRTNYFISRPTYERDWDNTEQIVSRVIELYDKLTPNDKVKVNLDTAKASALWSKVVSASGQERPGALCAQEMQEHLIRFGYTLAQRGVVYHALGRLDFPETTQRTLEERLVYEACKSA